MSEAERCPKCDSTAIGKFGNLVRCNQCGFVLAEMTIVEARRRGWSALRGNWRRPEPSK